MAKRVTKSQKQRNAMIATGVIVAGVVIYVVVNGDEKKVERKEGAGQSGSAGGQETSGGNKIDSAIDLIDRNVDRAQTTWQKLGNTGRRIGVFLGIVEKDVSNIV
jgi:hypothetical protein